MQRGKRPHYLLSLCFVHCILIAGSVVRPGSILISREQWHYVSHVRLRDETSRHCT